LLFFRGGQLRQTVHDVILLAIKKADKAMEMFVLRSEEMGNNLFVLNQLPGGTFALAAILPF
jgi:hypothetical protein